MSTSRNFDFYLDLKLNFIPKFFFEILQTCYFEYFENS